MKRIYHANINKKKVGIGKSVETESRHGCQRVD